MTRMISNTNTEIASASAASSESRNENRNIASTSQESRQANGEYADLVFKYLSNEIACVKIALTDHEPNGSKELQRRIDDLSFYCLQNLCHGRILTDLNTERLLGLFKNCRSVAKKYKEKMDNIGSVAGMTQVVEEDDKWKLLTATLADIEIRKKDLSKDDKKTKIKNKRLLLELGKVGFFNSLSNKDERVIKATQSLCSK